MNKFRHSFALLAIIIMSAIAMYAQASSTLSDSQVDSTSSEIKKPAKKVEFKFSGRVDLMIFYDSHKSVDSRGGVQYQFPTAPNYNDSHDDMNRYNTLRFSVAPTRLNAGVTINNIAKGATGRAFVEVDFMGLNEQMKYSVRLRHAFFSLNWKRQSVLFGQTSHLTALDEMAANTVSFGCGYPFNPLSRPVQAQFTQRWGSHAGSFTVAAAMHHGTFGDIQSKAVIPDIQIRLTFGRQDRLFFGVVGGFKSVKPEEFNEANQRVKTRINTFNAAACLKYSYRNGHSLRLFGIWGQDLSPLSIIGGYAPLASGLDSPATAHTYGYAPVEAVSVWFDYDSRIYNSGLQYGLFFGLQQNLGTTKNVNLTDITTIPNYGIDNFYRIAPRLWYNVGKHLQFGIEYSYTGARWAKEMNSHYQPSQTFNETADHRLTFLARFKF